jgi:hypothetical protein
MDTEMTICSNTLKQDEKSSYQERKKRISYKKSIMSAISDASTGFGFETGGFLPNTSPKTLKSKAKVCKSPTMKLI